MPYIEGMTTDRGFYAIDQRFALKLGDEIRARIERQTNITVLDIACGPNGNAITDLVVRFKGKIRGIGIDYHLDEVVQSSDLTLVEGDLFDIPTVIPRCADIAYCSAILPKLGFDITNWPNNLIEALYSISQSLLVGGKAYLDEGVFSADYKDLSYTIEALNNILDECYPNYKKQFKITNDSDLGHQGNYLIIERIGE